MIPTGVAWFLWTTSRRAHVQFGQRLPLEKGDKNDRTTISDLRPMDVRLTAGKKERKKSIRAVSDR